MAEVVAEGSVLDIDLGGGGFDGDDFGDGADFELDVVGDGGGNREDKFIEGAGGEALGFDGERVAAGGKLGEGVGAGGGGGGGAFGAGVEVSEFEGGVGHEGARGIRDGAVEGTQCLREEAGGEEEEKGEFAHTIVWGGGLEEAKKVRRSAEIRGEADLAGVSEERGP